MLPHEHQIRREAPAHIRIQTTVCICGRSEAVGEVHRNIKGEGLGEAIREVEATRGSGSGALRRIRSAPTIMAGGEKGRKTGQWSGKVVPVRERKKRRELTELRH